MRRAIQASSAARGIRRARPRGTLGIGSGAARSFRMRPSEESKYLAAVAILRYSRSSGGVVAGGADASLRPGAGAGPGSGRGSKHTDPESHHLARARPRQATPPPPPSPPHGTPRPPAPPAPRPPP